MMCEKAFDVLAIIALRKSKFYQKTRDLLLKQLPSDVDQKDLRQKLREAIAKVDNNLFMSAEERKTNTIDPAQPLESLHLNAEEIKNQVLRELVIPVR